MVRVNLHIRKIGWLVACNLFFWLVCLQMVTVEKSHDYKIKQAAVKKAIQAQVIIGPRLLGEEYTPITTTLGPYEAKKLSQHPDFAAVAVEMLTSAGIYAGDRVAVNFSGSFPALNISVLAAIDAIGAKPVITSSVGSSTWGANRPEYTWLDMEYTLAGAGIWPWRSKAVSIGGEGDNGGGMGPEGVYLARQAIIRSGLPEVGANDLAGAINRRIEIYKEDSQLLPKVLINVGGSHVIFGEKGHNSPLRQGLTKGYRPSLAVVDGLAGEFANSNRPVIHFINIARMAAQYGIQSGDSPGESRVFYTSALPAALRVIILIWIVTIVLYLWQGRQKGWWGDGSQITGKR